MIRPGGDFRKGKPPFFPRRQTPISHQKKGGRMTKMPQTLSANILPGLAMVALAIFCLYQIQASELSSGAADFPRLLSFVLGGLSSLLIGITLYNYVRTLKKQPAVAARKRKTTPFKEELYPFLIIFFCIFFMVFFDRIGFELSAFLVMFAVMLLMDAKKALRKIYLAVVTPLALILIFKVGMGLRIPLLIQNFIESVTK